MHGSHVENMSNHEHQRRNPPVTQPPQSGNISTMFLFCRFHKRDIDGIAIFVRLIRSINAIRKEKPWPASAQPRKRSRKRRRKPHHTLRCLFPALSKPYPAPASATCSTAHSPAMRMSCAKVCAGCAHSRNRYEKPVQGKGKTWTGTRKGREESVQTYLAASFLSSLFGMTQNLSSG